MTRQKYSSTMMFLSYSGPIAEAQNSTFLWSIIDKAVKDT
jgi:hypothetical protein